MKAKLRQPAVVAAVAALCAVLVVALGWAQQHGSEAEAADPDLEFNMDITGGTPAGGNGCTTKGPTPPTAKGDAVCLVPLGGAFEAVVRLDDPGALSGQVAGIQAVIAWTGGVIGPGDPGSTKSGVTTGCSDGVVGVVVGNFGGVPHTAGAGCGALPPPFPDAIATGVRFRFRLNCPPSPTVDQVTMKAGGSTPSFSTHMTNAAGTLFIDKDGSEVISVHCTPAATPEEININASLPVVGKAAGTCWRISHFDQSQEKLAYDVVGDDTGGQKPDCGEPSNQVLFDKDPAAGNLRITISPQERFKFGDLWFAQMSHSSLGKLDPTKNPCDLSLGKCEIGVTVVGGLSVDLDDRPALPAQGDGASGDNSVPSTGIALAVAGALAVGGAAWQARRRLGELEAR